MFIILKLKRMLFVLLALVFIFSATILYLKSNNNTQTISIPEHHYKVYLTFDDGPSFNTEKALDVLKSHDVKATFFVIGQSGDYEISLYRRIIAEGHSLGLHSYTHNTNKIYGSTAAFAKDFEHLRDWIFETTGTSPKLCRMVGGSHSRLCPKNTRAQIVDYFRNHDYTCYDWDIDPLDSGSYALGADAIVKNIVNAAQKKPNQDLVILLHDDKIRKTLPEALNILIPFFKEQGYTFDPLSDDTILTNSRALVKK